MFVDRCECGCPLLVVCCMLFGGGGGEALFVVRCVLFVVSMLVLYLN